jgi:hypothetical protein
MHRTLLIVAGLLLYMSTKILTYYFLVERAVSNLEAGARSVD